MDVIRAAGQEDIAAARCFMPGITGRGSTGLSLDMVSEFLGAQRAPVDYTPKGKTRHLRVGKKIQGEVTPLWVPIPVRTVPP